MTIELIDDLLKYLTLLSGLCIISFLVFFTYLKTFKKKLMNRNLFDFLNKNYLLFSFIITLTATLGSLFYSEIMGYNPCILCWYQRIFMYPQVLLFLIAFINKNEDVVKYSLPLSIIGGIISFYHYMSQIGVLKGTCDVVGYSSSCSETFFVSFGYITIPMMALTAFVLITILGFIKLTNINYNKKLKKNLA